jgi:hypothetical protein
VHILATFFLKQFCCASNVRTAAIACRVAITHAITGIGQFVTRNPFEAISTIADIPVFSLNAFCIIFADRITDSDVTIFALPSGAATSDVLAFFSEEDALPGGNQGGPDLRCIQVCHVGQKFVKVESFHHLVETLAAWPCSLVSYGLFGYTKVGIGRCPVVGCGNDHEDHPKFGPHGAS